MPAIFFAVSIVFVGPLPRFINENLIKSIALTVLNVRVNPSQLIIFLLANVAVE